MFYVYMFIIGSIFGSFLNAYSLRVSSKVVRIFEYMDNNNFNSFKSLINEFRLFKYSNKPKRSICPKCKFKLKWYHNIPLLSYIMLKGRCSNCNTSIPIIYLLSEMLLGFTFVLYYYIIFDLLNMEKDIIGYTIFVSYLIISSILYSSLIIDMKTKLIPDYTYLFILLPMLVITYLTNFNILHLFNDENFLNFFDYILTPVIFYYVMYLITYIIYMKFNKVYMGLGDIKFISFTMILYGFSQGILILMISAYISILPMLYIKYIKKDLNKEIPYLIYLFISFVSFYIYKEYVYSFLGII